MKYSFVALITLMLINGCAHKQRVQPNMEIPKPCILGAKVNSKACEPLNDKEALCHDVVVKFACVKVKQ